MAQLQQPVATQYDRPQLAIVAATTPVLHNMAYKAELPPQQAGPLVNGTRLGWRPRRRPAAAEIPGRARGSSR